MPHVDSRSLHTKYACVIWKYYTILTAEANTNTFQGRNGTNGTSFSLTDRCRSVHLSIFSKHGNEKRQWQSCMLKLKLKEKAIPEDYRRCPFCQSP